MESLLLLIASFMLIVYIIWALYIIRQSKIKEDIEIDNIEKYFQCKKEEEIARYIKEKEALAKENYFYNVGAIEDLVRGVETDKHGLPIFKKRTSK